MLNEFNIFVNFVFIEYTWYSIFNIDIIIIEYSLIFYVSVQGSVITVLNVFGLVYLMRRVSHVVFF